MKKVRGFFVLIALISIQILSISVTQAFMAKPQTLEELVANSGTNSIWFYGEVKSVEESESAFGWKTAVITLQGDILKDVPDDYVHPLYGPKDQWIKDVDGQKEFKVRMLSDQMEYVKNIGEIPKPGVKFMGCITGASKVTGMQGWCAASNNGFFEEKEQKGKKVLVNRSGNKFLTADEEETDREDEVDSEKPEKDQQKSKMNTKDTSVSENSKKDKAIETEELEAKVKNLVKKHYPETSPGKAKKVDQSGGEE